MPVVLFLVFLALGMALALSTFVLGGLQMMFAGLGLAAACIVMALISSLQLDAMQLRASSS